MRISSRGTIYMGPLGWLILGPFLLAIWLSVAVVVVAVWLVVTIVGWLARGRSLPS